MARRANPICDTDTLHKLVLEMGNALAPLSRLEGEIVATGIPPTVKVRWSTYVPGRPNVADVFYAQRTTLWSVYTTVANGKYVPGATAPGAASTFQAILQNYEVPARLRAKLEAASRFYSGGKQAATVKNLLDISKRMREFHAAAEEALAKGTPHGACVLDPGSAHKVRELHAGPFRLVNTGGFDAHTMQTVQRVVEEAADRLASHRLGGVLYGDVNVSNSLSGRRVLAFYKVTYDEMFVRADIKKQEEKGFVRTALHELGHRYEAKFLKKADIDDLYQRISREERFGIRNGRVRLPWSSASMERRHAFEQTAPKPGEEITVGRRRYEVTSVTGYGVNVLNKGTGRLGSFKAEDYLALKNVLVPVNEGFVTKYAKKSPSENFAEMFALYCMDELSPDHAHMMDEIMKERTAPVAKKKAPPKREAPRAPIGTLPPAPKGGPKLPPFPTGSVDVVAERKAMAAALRSTLGKEGAFAYVLQQTQQFPDDATWVDVLAFL